MATRLKTSHLLSFPKWSLHLGERNVMTDNRVRKDLATVRNFAYEGPGTLLSLNCNEMDFEGEKVKVSASGSPWSCTRVTGTVQCIQYSVL